MAMTLEQKVGKKAKVFKKDNLKFKKGLAAVLKRLDEEAVEYSYETTYRVTLHFKSKASIKRVGDALGSFTFDKKRVLANYERGYTSVDLTLTANELFMLECGLNIHRTLDFMYMNHYTGEHYGLTIDPRNSLPKEYEGRYTGSTADSEPLSDYFKGLQERIIKGGYGYLA